MGRSRSWPRIWSHVPWWLPHEDLVEADDGEIAFVRDLSVEGRAERHLAMHVVGQFDRGLSLGLVAIRCERKGGQLVPLGIAIPETPVVVEVMVSQQNPQRVRHGYGAVEDDGA